MNHYMYLYVYLYELSTIGPPEEPLVKIPDENLLRRLVKKFNPSRLKLTHVNSIKVLKVLKQTNKIVW